MPYRISRAACMAFFAAILSACVLAPGEHMDTSSFEKQEADTKDYRENVKIVPINGALVSQQMQALQESRKDQKHQNLPPFEYSDYSYKIGPQDSIKVIVWDHPELGSVPGSGSTSSTDPGGITVGADGNIFFPYAGQIHVAGKTVAEVRQEVTQKLSEVAYKNPQVDVRVVAYRSQKATVSGEVNSPAVEPITDVPMTIMDAINAAGGPKPTSDLQHVSVVRGGKTYVLDVFSLINRGDKSQNMVLQGNDVVYVPDNSLNKVFVLGEVQKPGSYYISDGRMSLAEALGDVGGMNENTSNPSKVYVIRAKRDVTKADTSVAPVDRFDTAANLNIFELDASSPDSMLLADQFLLSPRDVVYVSTAEIIRWGRVMRQLLSTVQATYMGANATRTINLLQKGK